jgi:hypothetical protein
MEIISYGRYIIDMVKYSYNVNRNDLIDPLTAVIRTGLLSYKPVGTKISIQNNRIYLQESSIIQGTVRSIYGDKKTDINILFGPIISACIIFLNSDLRPKYIDIFKTSSVGLTKLKETYIGTDIVYNIEQIKNIIDSFLNNDSIDPANFIANYQSQSYKLKTDIYKHIGTVWNEQRLSIVFSLISELSKAEDHVVPTLLSSLSAYLDSIDSKVCSIIKDL